MVQSSGDARFDDWANLWDPDTAHDWQQWPGTSSASCEHTTSCGGRLIHGRVVAPRGRTSE